MTEAEALAILKDHGFEPGMSTRGLDPEVRQAVKAALTALAAAGARPPPRPRPLASKPQKHPRTVADMRASDG